MKISTRLSVVSSLLLASQMAVAAPYIMVSPDDYQSFKSSHNTSITSSIIDAKGAHWKQYSNFLGKKNAWLWVSSDGQQLYWKNDDGSKQLLVDFDDTIGTKYDVQIGGCTHSATLAQKGGTVTSSAGQFEDAVQLSFSGYCFDEGLESAWFVPQIGLVRWNQDSILGSVAFELQHAKVDGMTVPNHKGLELTAQFPSEPIIGGQQSTVEAYITLRNHSERTVSLDFRSGQTFDIYLYDEHDQLVQQWSRDRMFTQALQTIDIQPGEVKRFGDEVELIDQNGKPLDIGTYRLKVEIVGSYSPEASAFSQQHLSAEAPLYIDKMMTLDK
ncbi:BsuPI-related putative proteinase inhibitor [Kangiella shandongensis]|uniref:BsuPI-related putative proteinase inhibitor n=1 Tax=Kangiella shandongensis TaxID=2763258 RepID=UPI001CBCD518|nr:BsuPI-related putative proteinase inhibitor [Kangiella shandongensis]